MSSTTPMSLQTLDSLRNDQALEHPERLSKRGTPTWEVAYFYPLQGEWEESDYLSLGTNWMIEFDDGCIEVLPMPTIVHQLILDWLLEHFKAFVRSHSLGGKVLFAPIPVELWDRKHRQPDLLYLSEQRWNKSGKYPTGADLVVEIVSEGRDDQVRDYETKRAEYARAGIPEYWIVDPQEQLVTVLTLAGDSYQTHGEFRPGEQATSVLLDGLQVDVAEMFRAAEGPDTAQT